MRLTHTSGSVGVPGTNPWDDPSPGRPARISHDEAAPRLLGRCPSRGTVTVQKRCKRLGMDEKKTTSLTCYSQSDSIRPCVNQPFVAVALFVVGPRCRPLVDQMAAHSRCTPRRSNSIDTNVCGGTSLSRPAARRRGPQNPRQAPHCRGCAMDSTRNLVQYGRHRTHSSHHGTPRCGRDGRASAKGRANIAKGRCETDHAGHSETAFIQVLPSTEPQVC
jgi:hypothetical protein